MKIADLLDMHLDGGANVFAITDRRLFCFYFEVACDVFQVSGSKFSARGWGGVLIKLDNTIHMISPVFHCPNNPKNTFSPSALKIYSGFQHVMEDTHRSVYFTDHQDKSFYLPCQIYNSLDYITIEIFSCQDNCPTTNAVTRSQTTATNFSSNQETIAVPLTSKTSTSTTNIFNHFPASVIAHIASYIINYVPHHHPDESDLMNLYNLFDMKYRPTMKTINDADISDCQSLYDEDIIYPVMDKLYHTKVPNYTSLQQYKKLHLMTMHLGKRTLQTMIEKGTMTDVPDKTLDGINLMVSRNSNVKGMSR